MNQDGEVTCGCGNRRLNRSDLNCWSCGNRKLNRTKLDMYLDWEQKEGNPPRNPLVVVRDATGDIITYKDPNALGESKWKVISGTNPPSRGTVLLGEGGLRLRILGNNFHPYITDQEGIEWEAIYSKNNAFDRYREPLGKSD